MANMNNLENPSNRNITPITQIDENGSTGYKDQDWSRIDTSKADQNKKNILIDYD